jgi:hypothetical protein
MKEIIYNNIDILIDTYHIIETKHDCLIHLLKSKEPNEYLS